MGGNLHLSHITWDRRRQPTVCAALTRFVSEGNMRRCVEPNIRKKLTYSEAAGFREFVGEQEKD
ncbi:MAG: hypothetical protein B6D36_02390 [Planctomycetes bacterium UTPLA1]|nr:MAG: hypothetical protein B6D36_02390 [Planctomycetes bacterium UTPLA1]